MNLVFKNHFNFSTTLCFLVILILFFSAILLENSLFYSVMIILLISMFMITYKNIFPYLLVITIPFTYVLTIFLFNSEIFSQESFKIVAFIKIFSFLIFPIVFYYILNTSKYKITTLDIYKISFLLIVLIYLFIGSFNQGERVSQLQPLLFFLLFIYLGRLFYYSKINLHLIEKSYMYLALFVVFIGVWMYIFADTLEAIGLSPKKYSIESVGMKERQFIGIFNASTYSFLFYDSFGVVKRFFSIFYSGIGLAYFSSYAFILAFLTNKKIFSFLLLLTIIATLTRGSWILLFISYFGALVLYNGSKKTKLIALLFSLLFVLLFVLKYENIISTYLQSGFVDVFSFSTEDQSAAAHLFSVFIIFDLIKNSPLGSGVGFATGESFLVDIFGQMGILGLFIFFIIFYKIHKSLKYTYKTSNNIKYFIAGVFLIFNLIGGLISKENYTFIVSYFSWIYIGYIYEMSRREKNFYENIS